MYTGCFEKDVYREKRKLFVANRNRDSFCHVEFVINTVYIYFESISMYVIVEDRNLVNVDIRQ